MTIDGAGRGHGFSPGCSTSAGRVRRATAANVIVNVTGQLQVLNGGSIDY